MSKKGRLFWSTVRAQSLSTRNEVLLPQHLDTRRHRRPRGTKTWRTPELSTTSRPATLSALGPTKKTWHLNELLLEKRQRCLKGLRSRLSEDHAYQQAWQILQPVTVATARLRVPARSRRSTTTLKTKFQRAQSLRRRAECCRGSLPPAWSSSWEGRRSPTEVRSAPKAAFCYQNLPRRRKRVLLNTISLRLANW